MPTLIGIARRAKRLLTGTQRDGGSPRRYISPALGVQGFFKSLKDAGIRYVVLRWFELLPLVEKGEDIDILVADEDLEAMKKYLRGSSGRGIPCDIYSVSGLPGSGYRGIAYFPVDRAQELIESSRYHAGMVRVPDPRRHFLSMAYHALYHKGFSSGLPSGQPVARASKMDHDYARSLREIANAAAMSVSDFTLEGIDNLLAAEGWRPSRDTLKKLSARNGWISDHFFKQELSLPPHWRGFTVFIVRELGVPYLDEVTSILRDEGFAILASGPIEGNRQQRAARELRGGNWGRGPFPMSGGLPAHAIAAYDCHPVEPDENLRRHHPGLENARIQVVKRKVRDLVNEKKRSAERCNIVHSADNASQAIEYAGVTMDLALDAVEDVLKSMHAAFATPFR